MPEGVYRRIPGISPVRRQNDILWRRAEKSISPFCGSATLTHEEIATSVLRCSLYLDQGISERVPLEKSPTKTDTGSLGQQRVHILGFPSFSVPECRPWMGISGDHSNHTSAYRCNSVAAPGGWWQASWGMAFRVSQAMTTECEWMRAVVQRDREQETKNSSQGEEIGGWWDTGWQMKLGFKSLSASFPQTPENLIHRLHLKIINSKIKLRISI